MTMNIINKNIKFNSILVEYRNIAHSRNNFFIGKCTFMTEQADRLMTSEYDVVSLKIKRGGRRNV